MANRIVVDNEKCIGCGQCVRDCVAGFLEVKDGSETVRIFGVASEDGEEVKDFVLYAPDDCALVCLFGSISMEAVASMVEA